MRIPVTEHTARPWRIHEIAADFAVEDVWAHRTPGAGPDDFPAVLAALRAAGGLDEHPPVVRFLSAVRWKLGALFGWDEPEQGLVGRVGSLRDRLPPDLRQDAAGAAVPNTPITTVYELPDECAIELANETVRGICHLGWVPTDDGEYELHMAALVRPNGRFGRARMAATKPFRYLIVYPALTRRWERAWRNRDRSSGPGARTTASTARHPGTAVVRQGSRNRDEPRPAAPRHECRSRTIRWAGWLIALYGTAHTVGALTVEGAAGHAGAWFSGALWRDDLADMSPANSAYWLSVDSFGVPLTVVGLTVLWLDGHGITPPPFIAWTLGIWTVVDAVVLLPTPWPILLLATVLLLAGARRAEHRDHSGPRAHTTRSLQESTS
ncbi:DUF2867 domain-containing protein [Geodermatophilus sp. URMC 60]